MIEEHTEEVHERYSDEEYKHHVKSVYKTTGILAVVTVVEVVVALLYESYGIEGAGMPRIPLMIFVTLASLVKAYWIMAVFMHVKYETKGFILSILVPTLFLVWAIIAFMLEGDSWGWLRENVLNGF
jgi:cytochrome c oxidase subunit IV